MYIKQVENVKESTKNFAKVYEKPQTSKQKKTLKGNDKIKRTSSVHMTTNARNATIVQFKALWENMVLVDQVTTR